MIPIEPSASKTNLNASKFEDSDKIATDLLASFHEQFPFTPKLNVILHFGKVVLSSMRNQSFSSNFWGKGIEEAEHEVMTLEKTQNQKSPTKTKQFGNAFPTIVF